MPKRRARNVVSASKSTAISASAAKAAKAGTADVYKPSKGYKEKILANAIDLPILFIIMILLVLGIVMMFSASYAWATYDFADGLKYVKRQVVFAGIGLAGMFIVSNIDYHFFRKTWVAYSMFIISLGMLVYVAILGTINKGAQRWIYIGPEGSAISFQPSEIMKFAIIVMFALVISNNYQKMKQFKYGIFPFLIMLGPVAGLMLLQPHLSGTLLICTIGIIMIYVGGAKISQLLGLGLIGGVGILGVVLYLVNVKGFDYFEKRIQSWIDPFSATTTDTWQTQQSLIAIGSGGIFGMGLGNSRQKFMYLPEAQNDFVFAVVCEELGLIGAMMVILLFALFVFRGFYIASKSHDKFGMMLAVGLTVQIGIQALLNIAVVTNTIPNTGISLPFFSYGGTALTMQLVQMGVLLNISKQIRMET